jgi:hypothetical protein
MLASRGGPSRTPWGDVSGSTYHFQAFRSGSLEVLSLINIHSLNPCQVYF